MNPEKQRIAIAEACGWTRFETGPYDGQPFGIRPGDEYPNHKYLVPDYLSDLNVMHEAEKMLDNKCNLLNESEGEETQLDRYIGFLEQVVLRDCAEEDCYSNTIKSTASQRAEAFLKTIGKWEEE